MHQNWNANLCAIREATSLDYDKVPSNEIVMRTAINSMLKRSKGTEVTPFSIDQAIIFYLQIISLPNKLVSPIDKALILVNCIKLLRRYVILFGRIIVTDSSSAFFDYFNYLVPLIDDSFLYVYLNTSKEQFKDWIMRVKKQLIKLIYRCHILKLTREQLEHILSPWIVLKIIDPIKELPFNIEVTAKKLDYEVKGKIPYVTAFLKLENIMGSIYTAKYIDIAQSYFRKMSYKRENQVSMYIQYFYELMVLLQHSEKRRLKLFESHVDFLGFKKSYIYSTIEYFLINVCHINSFQSFITLMDVLRISYAYLTDGNRRQLRETYSKYYLSIDVFKYNVDELTECLLKAFNGIGFFIIEDEEFVDHKEIVSCTREKNEAELKIQLSKSIKNFYLMEEKEKMYYEVISSGNKELLVNWIEEVLSSSFKNLDEGKVFIRILKTFYLLKGITIDSYTKTINQVKKKLCEEFKAEELKKALICDVKILPKEKLPSTPTIDQIHTFIKNNTAYIEIVYKKLTEMLKQLHDKLRPKANTYKDLNVTTKRLNTALENIEARAKIVGSGAIGVWSGGSIDYLITSDIDIPIVMYLS